MISDPETSRFDVVVVGSGASGLACAVACAEFGLSVCVVEKTAQIGGTSAWSGGWLWAPGNHYSADAGGGENGAHWQYLRAEIGEANITERLRAFVDTASEMVRFFAEKTDVQFFNGAGVADFHSNQPGARPGHRAVCALPFDGRLLGDDLKYLRPPMDLMSPFGMGIAPGPDLSAFFNWRRDHKSFFHVAKRMARTVRDRVLGGRPTHLVNGNALIARLLFSARKRGVTFFLNTRAVGIIAEHGRTQALTCQGPRGEVTISARHGIVLASGGFPHDTAARRRAFRTEAQADQHFSAAPVANTGDGLSLAEQTGARVRFDLASPAGLVPVSVVPRQQEPKHFPHLTDRAKPGCIMVNQQGRRFCNEAESYHDVTNALYRTCEDSGEISAWIVADHKSVSRYGLGYVRPWPFPHRALEKAGYVKVSPTLEGLAAKCGLPPEAFKKTVLEFNANAQHGVDKAFGRGETIFNRVTGDMTAQGHPTLCPLTKAPYYAIKVRGGSLSTFAGIETTEDAAVICEPPVEGLYAVGNDASSVADGHYPAGGFTLGPGMTFGYRAARDIKERSARRP